MKLHTGDGGTQGTSVNGHSDHGGELSRFSPSGCFRAVSRLARELRVSRWWADLSRLPVVVNRGGGVQEMKAIESDAG
ncbi:hypothetical protein E3N88_19951 [Mikania micrantha]|uniref:Uncharacterized protein n=1 Tax=Mikania micrantha TaxID=192012 RepID=A0A5N6NHD5_9ASTR|nr:hypothetical protein E3N88_19951 [Mikania micrantha]